MTDLQTPELKELHDSMTDSDSAAKSLTATATPLAENPLAVKSFSGEPLLDTVLGLADQMSAIKADAAAQQDVVDDTPIHISQVRAEDIPLDGSTRLITLDAEPEPAPEAIRPTLTAEEIKEYRAELEGHPTHLLKAVLAQLRRGLENAREEKAIPAAFLSKLLGFPGTGEYVNKVLAFQKLEAYTLLARSVLDARNKQARKR
jgi:hypothetical protein